MQSGLGGKRRGDEQDSMRQKEEGTWVNGDNHKHIAGTLPELCRNDGKAGVKSQAAFLHNSCNIPVAVSVTDACVDRCKPAALMTRAVVARGCGCCG